MGVNSIRSSLSKEDIISTIRLSLTAATEAHVVVEGEDDIKLLNGMFGSTVNLYESFSGKIGVIEIIEFFHEKYSVIGICDRDYDEYENEQIFYYDHNCAESMMVGSYKTLCTLCSEYHGCTENPDMFITEVLHRLKFLGLLRKYNSLHTWNIRFTGLSIHKLFSPHNTTDVANDILAALDAMNNGQATVKYHTKKQVIDCEDLSTKETLLDVVNGHDLLALLSVYFSVKHKSGAGIKTIAGHLRCSYDINEFKQTVLYTALKQYEISKGISLLIAS